MNKIYNLRKKIISLAPNSVASETTFTEEEEDNRADPEDSTTEEEDNRADLEDFTTDEEDNRADVDCEEEENVTYSTKRIYIYKIQKMFVPMFAIDSETIQLIWSKLVSFKREFIEDGFRLTSFPI